MAQIDFATDASCQMLREFLCVYCYISWFFVLVEDSFFCLFVSLNLFMDFFFFPSTAI